MKASPFKGLAFRLLTNARFRRRLPAANAHDPKKVTPFPIRPRFLKDKRFQSACFLTLSTLSKLAFLKGWLFYETFLDFMRMIEQAESS
ncbi:hypothetical protein BA724_08800 [Domibacillus iocasae]|uniref:Uncharacterized protein n=1 Tax=Domibacillus iocasae TaxID=1714016 RepID=A0A1E7DMS0_9BACI|nr:hypothetical protein BA724_08800 [Domibacillus iocasae]